METGSWSNPRSSSSPRRRTRSDKYREARGEDEAVERELRAEYTCPFCAEDFDVLGLCCHMDEEHPNAVKSGVCPVCTERVGEEMVVHITMQHEHAQCKRSQRKRGSGRTFSAFRSEHRERSLLWSHDDEGSSSTFSSSLTEPDSLLSSFLFSPVAIAPMDANPGSPDESPANLSGERSSESCWDTRKSPSPGSNNQDE